MSNRFFSSIAATGLSIALMLVVSSPSTAAGPTMTESTFSFTGGELDNVCTFPIFVDGTFTINQADFVNKTGALIRSSQHVLQQDKFYANGKTLVGMPYRINAEIRYDSSGNVTSFIVDGIVEKIPLPDGSLFISAGQLDVLAHPDMGFFLSPDKGNPGNIAKLCAALSP